MYRKRIIWVFKESGREAHFEVKLEGEALHSIAASIIKKVPFTQKALEQAYIEIILQYGEDHCARCTELFKAIHKVKKVNWKNGPNR